MTTTPPPDKQPAVETLEEIAERLAELAQDSIVLHGEAEQAILSALRNERERAIKALNDARHEGCTDLRELIARIR